MKMRQKNIIERKKTNKESQENLITLTVKQEDKIKVGADSAVDR